MSRIKIDFYNIIIFLIGRRTVSERTIILWSPGDVFTQKWLAADLALTRCVHTAEHNNHNIIL